MGRKRYREKEMSIYSSPPLILFFQNPRTQRLRHPFSLFPSLDYSEKRPRPSLEARNSWLVRSRYLAGSCPLSLSKIRSSEFLKYHVSSLSRSTATTRWSRSFDFSWTFQSYFATRRLRWILRASVCWDSVVSIYLRVSLRWLNYFSRSIGYKDLSSIAK